MISRNVKKGEGSIVSKLPINCELTLREMYFPISYRFVFAITSP